MQPAFSTPVSQAERISIIDTLRGIALLGILMMNIPYFAGPEPFAHNIFPRNELQGVNYYTWWIVNGFFEGTMRGLFSLLFGAGALLLLQKLEQRQPAMGINPADIYYRRLLWLFLFGMFNAYILMWPGDILYSYSICGLLLFPFRNMKAKHLLLIASAFLVFATAKQTYGDYKYYRIKQEGIAVAKLAAQNKSLNEDQKAALEQWTAYQEKWKLENIQKEGALLIRKIGQQGYFGVMAFISGINAELQSVGFYHFMFLDVMFLLFLGMALYKWKVLTGERSKSFYWKLLLVCYGLGIPLSIWEHQQWIAGHFSPAEVFERMPVKVYELRRILLALGHLSVLMLLHRYGVAKALLQTMARVGQMAFTNYLMQSIICSTIFLGFGFALYGKLQRYEMYYVVGAIWAFQIVFSNLWLRKFQFGPFEWMWRSLTYWKRQPMRRKKQQDETPTGTETIIIQTGSGVMPN